MKARVKFNKYGVVRFIGHLDVMRYFQKAMRRAGIDISYSQGYNPHQLMSFASPLGVGITSDGEYLDIALNSDIDKDEFIDRLNAQMVEGIEVLYFVRLKDDAKNSMSKVSAADYAICIKDDYLDDKYIGKEETFKYLFTEFIKRDEIVVLKKSKKSEKEVDIKEFILDYSFKNNLKDDSVLPKFNNNYYVWLKLAAGSVNNLKPELVMEAFCDYCNVEYNKFVFQTHRLEMYAGEFDKLELLSNVDVY